MKARRSESMIEARLANEFFTMIESQGVRVNKLSLSALAEKPRFFKGKTPGFSVNADRLIDMNGFLDKNCFERYLTISRL